MLMILTSTIWLQDTLFAAFPGRVTDAEQCSLQMIQLWVILAVLDINVSLNEAITRALGCLFQY